MAPEPAKPRPGSAAARQFPSRLPSLTGARAIAAGMVFLFHSTFVYPFAAPDAQKTTTVLFGPGGFAGVTFFFVLSGFVLAWAVRPTDTARVFWRRRFFKIYPNHLLTFLAAAVLIVGVGNLASHGGDALLQVLLLQSWHPDLPVRGGFNPVAWSLSCEALFYFAFPFLNKLIDKIRPERLWFATILSAAAVVSLPSFAMLLPAGQLFPPGFSSWELWFVYNLPPAQLLTFVFGIFMAKLVLTGRRIPFTLGGAVALAVGAYFVTPLFGPVYQFTAITLVPIGLVIAAAAKADVAKQKTFLGSRVMVWLGEVSFAFYVWHYLVIATGHKVLGAGADWSTPTTIAVMVLLLAVTLGLSWATFTFFERPIMQRFATSRRKTTPAVPTGDPTDERTDLGYSGQIASIEGDRGKVQPTGKDAVV